MSDELGEWIELTSRTDRTKVWVNLAAATCIVRETGGSRISLQGRDRDVYVSEAPEAILSKRQRSESSAPPSR